jgi:hypothetical protein
MLPDLPASCHKQRSQRTDPHEGARNLAEANPTDLHEHLQRAILPKDPRSTHPGSVRLERCRDGWLDPNASPAEMRPCCEAQSNTATDWHSTARLSPPDLLTLLKPSADARVLDTTAGVAGLSGQRTRKLASGLQERLRSLMRTQLLDLRAPGAPGAQSLVVEVCCCLREVWSTERGYAG